MTRVLIGGVRVEPMPSDVLGGTGKNRIQLKFIEHKAKLLPGGGRTVPTFGGNAPGGA